MVSYKGESFSKKEVSEMQGKPKNDAASDKRRLKNKKHRPMSKRSSYTALILTLAVFIAATAALAVLVRVFGGLAGNGGDTALSGTYEVNTPAAPLEVTDAENGAAMPPVGFGDIFRVDTYEELKTLTASGKLSEYMKENGNEPIIMLSDGIKIKEDITLDTPAEIFCLGDLVTENSARIGFVSRTDGEITILSNVGLDGFYIDAPNADLFWQGGNIPFTSEVAKYCNVRSYNGSAPNYEGITLGGDGEGILSAVTVYKNKKKTEIASTDFEITGNTVKVFYPFDFSASDIKGAYIEIDAIGGVCTLDTDGKLDLRSPQTLDIRDGEGNIRTYYMTAERKNYGIPILEINTEGGVAIDSNQKYFRAEMIFDGESYPAAVKGRGNASWRIFPKKAYRIKLDEKAKFFGLSSNRDWVLVSNYGDPSLIRNNVASDMANVMDALEYTPTHNAVDLYINGEYLGVYMFADKIEEAKGRVELGDSIFDENGKPVDMGFLLEFGWDLSSDNVWGKDFFNTTYCKRVYIKEPKIEVAKDDNFNYIYKKITAADKAISSGENWQEHIDMDSWIDWFLVNELTNNTECVFYRSLYMYRPVGGKITAGPIWDYDMAFGNHIHDIKNYDGWISVDSTYEYLYRNWMYFLLRDDEFVGAVKARWAEKKDELMAAAAESIERNGAVIREAQKNNFAVWPKVLKYQVGVSTASLKVHDWEKHLDYIWDFLEMRYEWMDERLTREGSILD